MARVWEWSAASGGGLLALLAIADFANDNGVAWPSLSVLAAKARLSVRQRCGEAYPFMEKDFGGFQTALRHYDVPRLKDLMALFFNTQNRWIREDAGFTVGIFVSRLASLARPARRIPHSNRS